MQVVRHNGFSVGIDHPAVWIDRGEQIVRDLVDVLAHPDVSPACVRHLVNNQHRLAAGQYELADGRGCLMFLLTEPLGKRQIRSKAGLIRFFGRAHGRPGARGYVSPQNSPEYQPAKWLVRLVDGQYCQQVRSRYGRACEFFDNDLVLIVAVQVLAQREAVLAPAGR